MKSLRFKAFREIVLDHYTKNGRVFPWRKTKDPYKILVSEIMLQQTQTDRVIKKYSSWLKKFPTFRALKDASLREVLQEWQGLGYNRRAIALKKAAVMISEKYSEIFPKTYTEILELPGVGPYTAGAIMAFAFNKPMPVIETNIRTAYIHFFFEKNNKKIHDKDILKLIEKTLDKENPRDWYYALMDYGAMLKKSGANLNARSMHHIKQSPFAGSDRELRAAIVRTITASPETHVSLFKKIKRKYPHATQEKMSALVKSLEKESFFKISSQNISLA